MAHSWHIQSVTVCVIYILLINNISQGKRTYMPTPPPSLAESINIFSFALHKTFPDDGNIVFSPWSVSFALGMIYLGARGKTLKEMQTAMHISHIHPDNIHYEFKQLREHLIRYDNQYEMNMFSTILVQEKRDISPVYKLKLQRNYDSDIHDVNFAELGQLVTDWINVWTSLKTGGKIKQIMTALPNQDTVMILLTANYFKGIWTETFSLNRTQPAFFYNSNNIKTNVDMMYATRNFSVYSGEKLGLQAVDVPMKGDVSFLFIMPDDPKDMGLLQRNLSSDFFRDLYNEMELIPAEVGIPRFKVSSRLDLQEPLKMVGMKSLFSLNQADLSGISNSGDLYVGEVIHKAALEIDEEGAVATSITVISIISRIKVYNLHFNRPFLYVIRDNRSGVILFMGRISEL